MELLSAVMEYYPYVVHPITVLGIGVLILIHYEWNHQTAGSSGLYQRVGGFLGAGIIALVPTGVYFLATGAEPIQATKEITWLIDIIVASGIIIAAVITWFLWRRFRWGSLIPLAMEVLVVVTVPYVLLSPFWNISGHVIIALTPTLFLTLINQKFWPLLVFPIVMIPNRVYLDAHTWSQSIGGFVLAASIVVGYYVLRVDDSKRTRVDAPGD